jgi:hypothetical protein
MRAIGAVVGLIIVACCGLVSLGAADSAAPSYPDWAAGVVTAYPHVLPYSGPITPNIYAIATTDQLQAVVTWYKSRVHGEWTESEGGNTWSVKSGVVRIQISKNYYDESANEKPGTRVALTKSSAVRPLRSTAASIAGCVPAI